MQKISGSEMAILWSSNQTVGDTSTTLNNIFNHEYDNIMLLLKKT